MSLRDQLLKAGVVDQKALRRTNQELEAERRRQRGERESRGAAEARAAEQARRRAQEAAGERIAARREREAQAEVEAIRRQADQLIRAWQVRFRGGPQPFWHRAADGVHIHRLYLSDRLAWELTQGRLAVAWAGDARDPDYVLLPSATARRVAALDPKRVVFHNPEPADGADPAEKLYESP